MYPYPSGDLHIGHWYAMAPSDAHARFMRMRGYNVLHPMGFDAFGLPAENAAINRGVHPARWTMGNIERMRDQLRSMGTVYDWDREIVTCDPDYYVWNQWFFLKMYEQGLAYRTSAPVNWCPTCQTVLANEQVVDGKCERCSFVVIRREMEQWFLRITDYADELLDFSSVVDWPERIKTMQTNWIGRSEGVDISFDISEYGLDEQNITTFTTRIDTIFGVTFVVLAPEHPLVAELAQPDCKSVVDEYVAAAARATEIERTSAVREKTGVPTGSYCINPLNGERVPILVGDYVLATYGTGAVMGVPAHDARDFDFAKKYDLPIRVVVAPDGWDGGELDAAYIASGTQVNSGGFDGLSSGQGKEAIADTIEANGWGERVVTYHLRDWLISRQRYWGTPIPVIYCDDCGAVPVPYEDLPVELPSDAKFQPSGRSPLIEHEEFLNAPCPDCGGSGKRETDTMDTFMDSSWYHMRYLSPEDSDDPFAHELAEAWAPVDQYTGGMEHAVMHLLYARFFNRALRDLGLLDFSEPYLHLFSHGAMTTERGRISKRSNPVTPDPLVREYGADTLRCYLMFLGPWDKGGMWTDSGINGVRRWMHRVWDVGTRDADQLRNEDPAVARTLDVASHIATKRVVEDIRAYKYNTAIATLMTYVNRMNEAWDDGGVSPDHWRASVKRLLLLLAPLSPHIAEELWLRNGWPFSIHEQLLPEWDEAKLNVDTVKIVVQVNGRVRDTVMVPSNAGEKEVADAALSSPGAQRHIRDQQIRREIYVPGRLFNIVVG
jgi:leucyl-tRNA synthetase